MSELRTPNDYRLFNFDFVDSSFDDMFRSQIVLKMFLEIDVIDKFGLSSEVTEPLAITVAVQLAACAKYFSSKHFDAFYLIVR